MPRGEDLIEYEYLDESDTLMGRVKVATIELGEASILLDYTERQFDKFACSSHYILDLRKMSEVSSSAIGVILNAYHRMRRKKGLLILVVHEELLRSLLFIHNEVFDHYAVFNTLEDALAYVQEH